MKAHSLDVAVRGETRSKLTLPQFRAKQTLLREGKQASNLLNQSDLGQFKLIIARRASTGFESVSTYNWTHAYKII